MVKLGGHISLLNKSINLCSTYYEHGEEGYSHQHALHYDELTAARQFLENCAVEPNEDPMTCSP